VLWLGEVEAWQGGLDTGRSKYCFLAHTCGKGERASRMQNARAREEALPTLN